MKKFFLTPLTFLIVLIVNGQNAFQKVIIVNNTISGEKIHPVHDGNFIVTGYLRNNSGNYDVYLVKTDGAGNVLWSMNYGGNDQDWGYDVKETFDNGFIVAGYTESFGPGVTDGYLIKTDSTGNMIWSKTFGVTGVTAYTNASSVLQASDSCYYVVGSRLSDIYLSKFDTLGNLVWTKTFSGNSTDLAYSVKQSMDGGIIICGHTESYGIGNGDVFLIKTDMNGNQLWYKTYGGSGADRGFAVSQTSDQGYIIGGLTTSFGSGGFDFCLIKTDSIGNLLWSKAYGDSTHNVANEMKQTADGGYILIGNSGGSGFADVHAIKTDSIGNMLWSKTYGGTGAGEGKSVVARNDGSYLLAGKNGGFGFGVKLHLIGTDSMGNSGCNYSTLATNSVNAPFQVTVPSDTVNSSGFTANSPVTISGNSNAVDSLLCNGVGIKELTTDNSFLLAPNPSAGNFNILFNRKIGNGNIEILNMLGENVYAENILNESQKEVIAGNITPGIYFVRVTTVNKTETKKIILTK
jgi:hypothetical protein